MTGRGAARAAAQEALSGRERTTPSEVNMHIERLVLDGFPPDGRHAVGDALGAELGRLLSERGVPERLSATGDIDVVRANHRAVRPPTRSGDEGGSLARTIYGALGTPAGEGL